MLELVNNLNLFINSLPGKGKYFYTAFSCNDMYMIVCFDYVKNPLTMRYNTFKNQIIDYICNNFTYIVDYSDDKEDYIRNLILIPSSTKEIEYIVSCCIYSLLIELISATSIFYDTLWTGETGSQVKDFNDLPPAYILLLNIFKPPVAYVSDTTTISYVGKAFSGFNLSVNTHFLIETFKTRLLLLQRKKLDKLKTKITDKSNQALEKKQYFAKINEQKNAEVADALHTRYVETLEIINECKKEETIIYDISLGPMADTDVLNASIEKLIELFGGTSLLLYNNFEFDFQKYIQLKEEEEASNSNNK